MARFIETHPIENVPVLDRTPERDRKLEEYLTFEIEAALSARHAQEELWREAKRQYAAIPRNPYRTAPVPNAPNIEVPLGAIAVDAQYASVTDALYSQSPVLSARALDEVWVDHAKAVQRWANFCAANSFGLRDATDHTFFDCCQLGTGGFYIPFIEDVYKHKVFNVRWRGPRVLPIAPENLLVPGGSRGDIQCDRWAGIRFWYMPDEMRLRSKMHGWNMDKTMPVASIDWVRRQHELIGATDSGWSYKELYEVFNVWCHYDYNDDGEDLDLLVTFDRSSRKVLKVTFNPYDTRPIEPCRYQIRPHLFYGIGIMEMMRPLQDEATEIHNHRILNMMIANARVWIALHGTVPESMEIWPNKVIEVNNSIDAIKSLEMGDVYPSSLQAEVATTSLAERRVGLEGGQGGRAALPIGTRTPGITAMTAVQAQNRRFVPAFDQMKFAAAAALRQGFLRQRERLLMNDEQVADHIKEVLGDTDGSLVIELLREPNFQRYVQVEFTAASSSVNREADRQNAILYGNFLKEYYRDAFSMVTALANPQVREEVVAMAKEVMSKSNEAMDRLLRTFEQLRDPQRFLVDSGPILDGIMQQNAGLAGMTQVLSQLAQEAQAQPSPNGAGNQTPSLDSAAQGTA